MGEAILGHRKSGYVTLRDNDGNTVSLIKAGTALGSVIINPSGWATYPGDEDQGSSGQYYTTYTNTNSAKYTLVAGMGNTADGNCGTICTDYAGGSFVAGIKNAVHGNAAFAAGVGNIAHNWQTVVGHYAKESTTIYAPSSTNNSNLFVVGNGAGGLNRSNAFRVVATGYVYYATGNAVGADYAEYFEWQDGNSNEEDRRGLFVTLDGEKIRIANSSDQYILGVVSACPGVIGDAKEDDWQGRWSKDIYGSIMTEDVIVPDELDENGSVIVEGGVRTQRVVNPDYDPNEVYIPRSERPEWSPVGLLGKLVVRDDGTCEVGKFCKSNDEGVATYSDTPGYYVMARLDETHVKVLVK